MSQTSPWLLMRSVFVSLSRSVGCVRRLVHDHHLGSKFLGCFLTWKRIFSPFPQPPFHHVHCVLQGRDRRRFVPYEVAGPLRCAQSIGLLASPRHQRSALCPCLPLEQYRALHDEAAVPNRPVALILGLQRLC